MAINKKNEISRLKAGIFIIISIVLLIFCVFWLQYFSFRPVMRIFIQFKNPGPLTNGLRVYYRGLNLGSINDIEPSEDYKSTIIKVNIYKKGLKIPANVTATVKSEGITGQKYIDLEYPETPSETFLSNNAVIAGNKGFDLSEVQDFISKHLNNGDFEKMIADFKASLKETRSTAHYADLVAKRANTILTNNEENVNNLILAGLGSTVGLEKLTNTLNSIIHESQLKKTLRNTRQITEDIKVITNDKKFQSNIKSTVSGVNEFVTPLDNHSDSIVQIVKDTGTSATKMMQDTSCTVNKIGYVSDGVAEMLGKRFLLFKLMFGQPGSYFTKPYCPRTCTPSR